MSAPQQPIELGTLPPDPSDVIDFGPAPRRRFDLVADNRLVPVLAALAGVAAVASLVTSWQQTLISSSALDQPQPGKIQTSADLLDLGGLGTGYIFGLMAVTAALVLVLFGPVAARHHVRIAGLGVTAATLAVVIGLGAALHRQSGAIPAVFTLGLGKQDLQLSYDRGFWSAALAVLLAGAALLIAGRPAPASPVIPAQRDASDLAVPPAEVDSSPFEGHSGRDGISG